MKTVETNVGNIVVLNESDIADVIESIFNSAKMSDLVVAAEENNISEDTAVNIVAELLVHYVCATGDTNVHKFDQIIDECIDNIKLLSNRSYVVPTPNVNKKQNLFEKTVYPHIENYWRRKLNIHDNELVSVEKISTAIGIQCRNNRFRTHSFNGALTEIVERDGLDISKEMFEEEYRILSKISGTPYSTGELYFCDLGAGTFSYMHRSPERFWNTIDGMVKEEKGEDIKEFAIRNLKELLKKHKEKLTQEELIEIYNAGMRMIDFYCSTPKVSIAITKPSDNITDNVDMSADVVNKVRSLLLRIPYKQRKKLPEDFATQLNKISPNKQGLIQLASLLDQYKQIDEELKNTIEEIITKAMHLVVEERSLNKFMNPGCLDGYGVEGGKMDRKGFALATVVDPILQNKHNQEFNR